MRCESCGKPATQIREMYSYCDKCWARKYSMTGGVPFLEALKTSLGKMGLTRK